MKQMSPTYQNTMKTRWQLSRWSSIQSSNQTHRTGKKYMTFSIKMMNWERILKFKCRNKRPRFKIWKWSLQQQEWNLKNKSQAWEQRWSWLLKAWFDRPNKNKEGLNFLKPKSANFIKSLMTKIVKFSQFTRLWSTSKKSKRRRSLSKNLKSICWEIHWSPKIRNSNNSKLISSSSTRERAWSWLNKTKTETLMNNLKKSFTNWKENIQSLRKIISRNKKTLSSCPERIVLCLESWVLKLDSLKVCSWNHVLLFRMKNPR